MILFTSGFSGIPGKNMVNEIKGNIFDIKRFALHDGPGIRTTLFMTGCPLDCLWCHNPESRLDDHDGGSRNRNVTSGYVIEELKKDLVFFEESGGGVTFSGGEPLSQPEFLIFLLEEMKSAMIHTAVDTTGYTQRSVIENIVPLTDLFLYDLKVMDPEKHKKYTGVDNGIILENLNLILDSGKDVRIRFPLIPGYNDDERNIAEMIRFLDRVKDLPDIDILPYHRLGISKYRKLSIDSSMEFLSPPADDKIEAVRNMLKTNGFNVGVEG